MSDAPNPQPYRAECILSVDFGTATTRASLFDVVEGEYRLVASGAAPSTCEAPFLDASEGLRHALAQLTAITGRFLLDDAARLIQPVNDDGHGCDTVVATFSAGPAVRAVLVGLLPEGSLKSARRVAESSYLNILDTLSLADRRRQEQQIEAIVKARPELILLAGGTDGGANAALIKLAETVGVGCFMLPHEDRPQVFYLGNQALRERIGETLSGITGFVAAPNAQPALGREALDAGRLELGHLVKALRARQIGSLGDLDQYAAGNMYPTALAEGQMVRFLSKHTPARRGVMSINVGSASTSVALAYNGELALHVATDLGVGVSAYNTLTQQPAAEFRRWLLVPMSDNDIRTFALNRRAYPHTLPMDQEDLQREYALARLAIRSALKRARQQWPEDLPGLGGELLPNIERLIGGGAVFGQAPQAGAAAMLLLDAAQPIGFTTLWLDRQHFLAALGALAYANPLAAVQVAGVDALLRLGTAVSCIGGAEGVVAVATLVDANQRETTVEVKRGEVEVLALPMGETGRLTVKPRGGADVGFGPGRAHTWEIDDGGRVGVIVDGRGRPLPTLDDDAQRVDQLQRWLFKFSGSQ